MIRCCDNLLLDDDTDDANVIFARLDTPVVRVVVKATQNDIKVLVGTTNKKNRRKKMKDIIMI
jgi:hypothetical protein